MINDLFKYAISVQFTISWSLSANMKAASNRGFIDCYFKYLNP